MDLSPGRKLAFTAIMLSLMIAATLVFVELAVRFVFPQPELYPRYRYSERYGHLLPASATIVNQLPGAWRFVYRTNEYGYRISMPEISNRYDLPNVVVLGDSFTFGAGVNDGEEYSAVLAGQLAGQASIVNLGVGGFGLTQEIRTFYEFGLLFQPSVVVLQFCGNDPDDNFYSKVTTVEDGRFRFHLDRSMGSALSFPKDWLSGSILQRSAAYNLVRNRAYFYWEGRVIERESAGDRQRKETFYNELLTAFAEDLRRRGIGLLVFDSPGALAGWPGIHGHVAALERGGLLRYLRTEQWFDGVSDYGSPEGHTWGVKGHRVVAERLVEPLRAALQVTTAAQAAP
jgi:hypothetical protein